LVRNATLDAIFPALGLIKSDQQQNSEGNHQSSRHHHLIGPPPPSYAVRSPARSNRTSRRNCTVVPIQWHHMRVFSDLSRRIAHACRARKKMASHTPSPLPIPDFPPPRLPFAPLPHLIPVHLDPNCIAPPLPPFRLRTPAEPMPPPIKEPPAPPENPDAPVREPDPEEPDQI
jgi:hypothetical protein